MTQSSRPLHRNTTDLADGKKPLLFLVNSAHGNRVPLLGLWHLCSLDAPTVAALWVWFAARVFEVPLPWTSIVSMFVAVWMLYAADRLLDARTPEMSLHLEQRHRFHHRHRKEFLLMICVASCLLAALLLRLTHVELRLFTALGSFLFAYFFLIHVWSLKQNSEVHDQARLPKELAVGLFVPAAVFIPTVSRIRSPGVPLVVSAMLLAIICTLNCLYVYAWEHPCDRSGAHWTTQYAVRNLGVISVCALALCAAVAAITPWIGGAALSALACGLSVLALVALHRYRRRFTPLILRASADLALLSPLLLIPLAAISRR